MKGDKSVRVQKAIADRGLASRREAERWIEEGRVTVNGEVVDLGARCAPGIDTISVDDNVISRREPPKVVIAMNKPKGYLCTNDDPHAKRTVFDLLPTELQKLRLFCVGRLDKDSEGLLLLTNDGGLQQQLAHPSYNVLKKYHVDIDHYLKEEDIPKLKRGIKWEGDRLALEKVVPRNARAGNESWTQLEVTLHHGKKREIRRLFYALGYDVKKLRRVQIGQFKLRGLPRAHIRTLRKQEIRLLFEAGD
ncbi:MAG: pseudouridine synthase [Opitutales bacterium]|jgi:23S rRNA pseudouridine2605 synthase